MAKFADNGCPVCNGGRGNILPSCPECGLKYDPSREIVSVSELNHNEPTKELVAVQLTCPYCEKKDPAISTMSVQFQNLICQIFFCAHCGKILTIAPVGQAQGPIVQPKVVLPGRM